MLKQWPGPNDYDSAKNWRNLVAATSNFASARVNMEYFQQCQLDERLPDGGIGKVTNLRPMPLNEIMAREDYYESAGVPVGASFDLRYWANSHADIPLDGG